MLLMVVLAVVNLIGYLYYTNYMGAVVGSAIGCVVGGLISNIRRKTDN